jgi:hypothetical protein
MAGKRKRLCSILIGLGICRWFQMGNELIYIDGQEGFISLNIFLEMDFYRYYSAKLHAERLKKNLESYLRNSPKLDYYEVAVTPNSFYLYDVSNEILFTRVLRYYRGFSDKKPLFKRLIVLQISQNHIAREFYLKKVSILDKGIDKLIMKIEHCHSLKSSYYKKKRIKECSLKIKRLKRLKKMNISYESFGEEHMKLIYSIADYIPKKYYFYNEEKFVDESSKYSSDYLILKTFSLSHLAIPYLEQQLQLGRIKFSEDQYNMLLAIKEAMRVRDDNMTFDSYIDDWAGKLLKESKQLGFVEKVKEGM